MQVGRDTVVSLKIQMYDAQGALLHAPEDAHVYLHGGYGGLLDALERLLEGKSPGETVRVQLEYRSRGARRVLARYSSPF